MGTDIQITYTNVKITDADLDLWHSEQMEWSTESTAEEIENLFGDSYDQPVHEDGVWLFDGMGFYDSCSYSTLSALTSLVDYADHGQAEWRTGDDDSVYRATKVEGENSATVEQALHFFGGYAPERIKALVADLGEYINYDEGFFPNVPIAVLDGLAAHLVDKGWVKA